MEVTEVRELANELADDIQKKLMAFTEKTKCTPDVEIERWYSVGKSLPDSFTVKVNILI